MQVLQLSRGGHVFGMDQGLWARGEEGEGRGRGGGGEGEEELEGRGCSELDFTLRPSGTERAVMCGCVCMSCPT